MQILKTLIADSLVSKVHLSASLMPILQLSFVSNTAIFRSYYSIRHMMVSLEKSTDIV